MGNSLSESEVVGLFVQHRVRLNAYACSILGDYHLAEDVLQETAVTLLKRRADYDVNRPFLPWALGITRIKALGMARARKREVVVPDEQVQGAMETVFERTASDEYMEARTTALIDCLQKVGARGRDLLKMKYLDRMKVRAIAELQKSSAQAVNSLLQRLRWRLTDCIERKMAEVDVA